MKHTIRHSISVAVAGAMILGGTSISFARISLADKTQSVSGFHDVVDAEFLPSGNRILVLSHVAASTVAKLDSVDPSTNTVVDTVIFNQSETGDDVDWTSAADLAVSADGSRAYVVFADASRVVAKIDTSTLTVLDYNNAGQMNTRTEPLRAIALRADDAEVNVFSKDGMIRFTAADMEPMCNCFSTIEVEDGVTNHAFAFDSDVSVTIWADRFDSQIKPNNRVNIHAANGTLYASAFKVGTVFSAIAMDRSRHDLILGTSRRKGKNYLVRAIDYRQTEIPTFQRFAIPSKAKGIRQIAVSSDGSRLVALTSNNRLLRIDLGGRWKTSLSENVSITKITNLVSADLAGDSVIAISPNGDSVYVFTENGWIIDSDVSAGRLRQLH